MCVSVGHRGLAAVLWHRVPVQSGRQGAGRGTGACAAELCSAAPFSTCRVPDHGSAFLSAAALTSRLAPGCKRGSALAHS